MIARRLGRCSFVADDNNVTIGEDVPVYASERMGADVVMYTNRCWGWQGNAHCSC